MPNSLSIPGYNKPGLEIHQSECGKLQAFFNGGLTSFWNLPAQIIQVFKSKCPEANETELECFVADNWGKLDSIPDLDEDGNLSNPEYMGDKLYFDNGTEVSPSEKRVLELIHLRSCEIADLLFLSHKTVENHISNMIRKSGLPDAKSLAVFAVRQTVI